MADCVWDFSDICTSDTPNYEPPTEYPSYEPPPYYVFTPEQETATWNVPEQGPWTPVEGNEGVYEDYWKRQAMYNPATSSWEYTGPMPEQGESSWLNDMLNKVFGSGDVGKLLTGGTVGLIGSLLKSGLMHQAASAGTSTNTDTTRINQPWGPATAEAMMAEAMRRLVESGTEHVPMSPAEEDYFINTASNLTQMGGMSPYTHLLGQIMQRTPESYIPRAELGEARTAIQESFADNPRQLAEQIAAQYGPALGQSGRANLAAADAFTAMKAKEAQMMAEQWNREAEAAQKGQIFAPQFQMQAGAAYLPSITGVMGYLGMPREREMMEDLYAQQKAGGAMDIMQNLLNVAYGYPAGQSTRQMVKPTDVPSAWDYLAGSLGQFLTNSGAASIMG